MSLSVRKIMDLLEQYHAWKGDPSVTSVLASMGLGRCDGASFGGESWQVRVVIVVGAALACLDAPERRAVDLYYYTNRERQRAEEDGRRWWHDARMHTRQCDKIRKWPTFKAGISKMRVRLSGLFNPEQLNNLQ